MIPVDPQQLYVTEQRLAHTPLRDRPAAFQRAGGLLTPPGDDHWDYLNTQWWAELMGLHAHGDSRTEAIAAWLRMARQRHRNPANTRATDGRPDCPYNGQGLAP